MFSLDIYTSRLRRAQELATQRGIGALIIAPGPDFAYLTGSWMSSHERLSALVIPARGEIRAYAPSTDVHEVSYFEDMGVKVVGWNDGQDSHRLVLGGLDAEVIAVSSSMTADHLLRLQELSTARFELAAQALAELFSVKDAAELEQLRACAHAIDQVHEQVPGLLRPGRTEEDVARDIEKLILAKHSAVDFIIVGAGPNGGNPHYRFGDRVLAEGDPVVVDIGGTFGAGYHSDCTRTYVVGGPDKAAPEFLAAYEALYNAQAAARGCAGPGVTADAVDKAARDPLTAAGYGEFFTHRTGHGIGLSTHEEPFIMAGNDLILRENMTFSIEPGIYLPGQWGMRLEDIVVTTATGCESLNQAPRQLR